jgi:hypothetical protein
MRLRFGLHLDGQHGRTAANQLGVSDVGPLGLLGILETQLGLVPHQGSPSERIVQYRDCLLKLDGASRFFHESLAADDFGTAASLLSWRDDWLLHGWIGEISATGSQRLADMADVETIASQHVAPGMAERLIATANALVERKHLIDAIELIDPPETFALLWQRVLEKLPCQMPQAATITGKGLLGEIQHAIIQPNRQGKRQPLTWRDDGTLLIARSETTLTGGRWIAETLRKSTPDVLYVATAEAAMTDAQLGAADYPRQGLSDTSAFRPALQLLPLTLELLWKPLNFHALIQFLTHPIAPIPARARRRLAGIQAEYPGVGGPRWHKVLAEIEADYGERAAPVREAIDFWIVHERFDPLAGAPIAYVLERAQRLAGFFRNSPGDASPALRHAYAAGFQQCQAFAENLGRLLGQDAGTLRPRQLEQLTVQSTARGIDNPLRVAEVGALPCISHPGAVTGNHSVVVWGPLDTPAMPSPWPWSKSELASLREAGCALPDTDTLLQQAASDWLRPILAAKDRLVLLLPPVDRESHPVWQMLDVLLPKIPVQPVEALLLNGTESLAAVVHSPLPGIKRWWQLPPGTRLPAVAEYSYSQLEKQIFNPYHWLLSYAARLRSGFLLSLADDFRLKGILAHSLVERFYEDSGGLGLSDSATAAWFDPEFDRLIAEEGALYLMPGRRTDLENLRHALRRALLELRGVLNRAGVTLVEAERQFAGHFAGGALGGKSDLVLTGPDSSFAIIDLKWGGKSHRPKLEKNRHLQLAIYAELLRQKTGRWPALAYFLFSQATLLTRDDLWFPGITPVPDRTGENTAQLWQRFLVTWQWRQEQIAAGQFEVVLAEGEDDESRPPDDGLAIEILDTRYNECLRLAGWDEQA